MKMADTLTNSFIFSNIKMEKILLILYRITMFEKKDIEIFE